MQTQLSFAVRGGRTADKTYFGHTFYFIADTDTEKYYSSNDFRCEFGQTVCMPMHVYHFPSATSVVVLETIALRPAFQSRAAPDPESPPPVAWNENLTFWCPFVLVPVWVPPNCGFSGEPAAKLAICAFAICHPAAKGERQKGIGKKVTKSVKKSDKTVTKR